MLDLAGSNVSESDNYLIHRGDTLTVVYNFWWEGGVCAFELQNRTDKPLYVDWKKCSFVVGGRKFDYWVDEQVASTLSTEYEIRESYAETILKLWNGAKSKGSTQSVSTGASISTVRKQERITFIPPKATIYRIGYLLLPNSVPLGGTSRAVLKEAVINVRDGSGTATKQPKNYLETTYTRESSPFAFRNFITYSFDEGFKSEYYIDNSFFLSKYVTMEEVQFRGGLAGEAVKGNEYYTPYQEGKSFYKKVEDSETMQATMTQMAHENQKKVK